MRKLDIFTLFTLVFVLILYWAGNKPHPVQAQANPPVTIFGPDVTTGTQGAARTYNNTYGRALLVAMGDILTPLGDSVMDTVAKAIKVTGTGTADATKYVTMRVSDGTNYIAPSICGNDSTLQKVKIDFATANYHELVACASDTCNNIKVICGYTFTVSAAATIKWAEGNGSNCGTNTNDLTGVMTFATGESKSNAGATNLFTASNKAFCMWQSGTVQVSGYLVYQTQ